MFSDEEGGYNLDETKYKLKVDNPNPPLPVSSSELDSEPLDLGASDGDVSTNPFDNEPFDAGVEADEDEDPEKYIQQLAGKLGTTLRNYSNDRGEPDFDLEKFAINSVISATHTSQMDDSDQKDIIRKVKTSGVGDNDTSSDGGSEEDIDSIDLGSEDKVDTGNLDEDGDVNMWKPSEGKGMWESYNLNRKNIWKIQK